MKQDANIVAKSSLIADPENADEFIANSAKLICALHKQTTDNILEIGRRLAAIKTLLGHGRFGPWIKTECSFGERTAGRYMSAAKKFYGKTDTMSEISISVMHALAAPKTSERVRTSVLAAVQQGRITNARQVTTEIIAVDHGETLGLTSLVPKDKKTTLTKQVATARMKLAGLIIKAAGDSTDKAIEWITEAQLPELNTVLLDVKKTRAQALAEFDARQLSFSFAEGCTSNA